MKNFLQYFFVISFLFFSFCLGAFFYLFEKEWVDFSSFENYSLGKPSIVLDEQGKQITKFALDKRKPITFDKLPNILIKAFLAAEDWNFFNHSGISLKGIARSFLINLYHGRIVQGASTITQQLARTIFLSQERTFWRKIQEVFITFQIERQLTKEQILELYLNNVYFGRGIYGVQAACKRFWNKSVLDISVDQAASLAAVAKSAYFYSPLNSPLTAKKRRNVVLYSMKKLNFITNGDYEKAITKNLDVKDHVEGNPVRLYIQEWIRIWAEKKWGRVFLYKKGLKIKTTIDLQKQALAEKVFCKKILQIRKKIDENLNGGMIVLEAKSVKIKAIIGGFDFHESQFNRAFQAVRQIGSTFKPFLYSSALKGGMSMKDVEVDEPIAMEMPGGEIWCPRNWHHRFEGSMTLVRALSLSNNIIAVKTLLKLGAKHVIDWAKKFGLKYELHPNPSLALGTTEATVEQVAASFNVFANYGTYIKPYLIEWVKDEWGTKIWENDLVKWKVLDSKTNSKMINALSQIMKRARILFSKDKTWINCESIGKTGATNLASTTWFVGSTPELTTCIYLGRDDNKPIGKHISASRTTFPIWLDFNKAIDFKKKHFYLDPELKEVVIDWVTGCTTNQLQSLRTVKILE